MLRHTILTMALVLAPWQAMAQEKPAQDGTKQQAGNSDKPAQQASTNSKTGNTAGQKASSPRQGASSPATTTPSGGEKVETEGPMIPVDQKDLEDARQFLCPAPEILQKNRKARNNLWALSRGKFKSHRYVTALKILQCLQRAVPYFDKLHYATAQTLEKLGQYPDAVEHYKSFLEMTDMDPNSTTIQAVKQKIKELSFKKPRPLPPGVLEDLKSKSLITKEERIAFQQEKLREEKARALAAAKSEAEKKAIEQKYKQMELHLVEMKRKLMEEKASIEKARMEAEKARLEAEKARQEAEKAKLQAEQIRKKAEEQLKKNLAISAYRYKKVPTRMRKTGSWVLRTGAFGVFLSSIPALYSYYLWETANIDISSSSTGSSDPVWWTHKDEWNEYEKWLTISKIGYGISAGLLLTGTVLYFVGGDKKVKVTYHTDVKHVDASPIFTPVLMPGGGGLAVGFEW